MKSTWFRSSFPIAGFALLIAGLALGSSSPLHAANGSALPYHAAPGSSVTFPSWTPADEPGTVQWYRDGVALPGKTAAQLKLPGVSAADSGTYRLVRSRPGVPDWIADYPLNVVAPPPTPRDDTWASSPLGYSTPSGYWSDPGLLAVLADGRLVVGAWARERNSGRYTAKLFFLRPDGTLIDSVSAGHTYEPGPIAILPSGRLVFPYYPAVFSSPTSGANVAAAETPDGRILLAYYSGSNPARLARLFADGSVDPSFQGPTLAERPRQLLVDSVGRILVWASTNDTGTLTRFLPDGSPDATFTPVTSADLWPATDNVFESTVTFTLLTDDSLVAKGQTPASGDFAWRWLFRRIAADGSLRVGGHGSITEAHRWSKQAPVIDPQGRAYVLNQHGVWRYFTEGDDALDPTFYGGVDATTGAVWDRLALLRDGQLLVSRVEAGGSDPFTVHFTTLRTTDLAPTFAPGTEVVSNRLRQDLRSGQRVVVTPAVFGTGPFAYEWFAVDGGTLPPDTTSRLLVFENFSVANHGRYQARVTGPGGTTLSGVVDLTPAYAPRLLALSGRGVIAAGEETLIAGWNAASSGWTLARAVGPSLAPYGVSGFAADPSLAVFDSGGQALLANDDWPTELAPEFTLAGAAPLLANSRDSAARAYLNGSQTLHLANRGGERGVALAEVYDANNSPWSNRLTALSLRGFAGRDSETLTAGFVLDDPAGFDRPIRLLLRALGPTLTTYGITRALGDPRLTIHRSDGSVVAANDDWSAGGNPAALAETMRALGLAVPPEGSKDAALELELPPGAYTAQITSSDGATGVALLEIYRVR